jgi:hypothetical protein
MSRGKRNNDSGRPMAPSKNSLLDGMVCSLDREGVEILFDRIRIGIGKVKNPGSKI